MTQPYFNWLSIFRLGLVQTALGAIVVLTTSTLNRVMVVELALPAMLPGALVALHYFVQITRPRWGYGSDRGGKLTPWIVGGMAVLTLGAFGASLATAWMETNRLAGISLAVAAFVLIGGGVGASGTSLLVLLSKGTQPSRRAAAATTVWVMMIIGFIITAGIAGQMLDPFSLSRLVMVTGSVCTIAFVLALLAVFRVERKVASPLLAPAGVESPREVPSFRIALAEVWNEPRARRLAIFVFVSMLAYSAQDLILEPFAGTVFGFTPGESTKLAGIQHSGVLAGMLLVAITGTIARGRRFGSLKAWAVGGCAASALALSGLVLGGLAGPAWPLNSNVFALGVANGAFAVGAIGSMMGMVSEGRERREGVRMGIWGAAQAVAFGIGGFLGTFAIDAARWIIDSPAAAYGLVFSAEAMMFVVAGVLATRIDRKTVGQEFESPATMTTTFATGTSGG